MHKYTMFFLEKIKVKGWKFKEFIAIIFSIQGKREQSICHEAMVFMLFILPRKGG